MATVVLQNDTLRLAFDRATGALVGLTAAQTGWEILNRPQLGLSFRLLVPLTSDDPADVAFAERMGRAYGERRSQLVQLVDIYPTVLAAAGRPLPEMPANRPLHGVNLLPVIENPAAHTRDFAVCGQFGHSVTLTDGEWILHQSPVPGNGPLFWHGYCLAKFLPYPLGPFADGRRPVVGYRPWPTPTWLSDKRNDPNELVNLAEHEPAKLREMQAALRETLIQLHAPPEQLERLGLIHDMRHLHQ